MDEAYVFKGTPFEFAQILDTVFESFFASNEYGHDLHWHHFSATWKVTQPAFDPSGYILPDWEEWMIQETSLIVNTKVTYGWSGPPEMTIRVVKMPNGASKFFILNSDDRQFADSVLTTLLKELESIGYLLGSATIAEIWEEKVRPKWLVDAVKMWQNGMTSAQIGDALGKDSRTVTNRMTELRNILGLDVVPYHKTKK